MLAHWWWTDLRNGQYGFTRIKVLVLGPLTVLLVAGHLIFDYLEEIVDSNVSGGVDGTDGDVQNVEKLVALLGIDVDGPVPKRICGQLGHAMFLLSIAAACSAPLSISYKMAGAAAARASGKAHITFMGYAAMVSGPVVLLLSIVIPMLIMLLEVPAVPGVGLLVVQAVAFLEIVADLRLAHVGHAGAGVGAGPGVDGGPAVLVLPPDRIGAPWSAVVVWFLFMTQYFYGTGHQASLTTVQWTAGLVGLSESNVVVSGLLVTLNTFGSQILFGLAIPLLITWRFPGGLLAANSGAQTTKVQGPDDAPNEYFLVENPHSNLFATVCVLQNGAHTLSATPSCLAT
jgi:hypothetical protein